MNPPMMPNQMSGSTGVGGFQPIPGGVVMPGAANVTMSRNLPWQQQQPQSQFQPQSNLMPYGAPGAMAGGGTMMNVGLVPGTQGTGPSPYGNISQVVQPTTPYQPPKQPSVFEDQRRIGLDLMVAKTIVEHVTKDGSPTVRYEATLSLACLVQKYLPAFAAVADETLSPSALLTMAGRQGHAIDQDENHVAPSSDPSSAAHSSEMKKLLVTESSENGECAAEKNDNNGIPFPPNVNETAVANFEMLWGTLRSFQHEDPYPSVASSANATVSVVYDHVLTLKTRLLIKREEEKSAAAMSASPHPFDEQRGRGWLLGALGERPLKEETVATSWNMGPGGKYQGPSRVQSMQSMGGGGISRELQSHDQPSSNAQWGEAGRLDRGLVGSGPGSSIGRSTIGTMGEHTTVAQTSLRRNVSDQVTPGMLTPPAQSHYFQRDVNGTSKASVHHTANSLEEQFKIAYFLPKSKFYQWKRKEFERRKDEMSGLFGDDAVNPYVDPLSFEGAIQAYREQRNIQAHEQSQELSEQFSVLVPNSPQQLNGRKFHDTFGDMSSPNSSDFDFYGDDDEAATFASLEADIASKKRALHHSQKALLINKGADMTSMLHFHPYEPALVICDGCDKVSVWDTDSKQRFNVFSNRNPKKSRITSISWINEMSTSLLLTGSDDGVVRIWEGLIEFNGEISQDKPTLCSAFFAAPELAKSAKRSGLVTDWQQFTGRLIAGGNTSLIRCWDLEAEKCCVELENRSDACVTTLTTAWDHVNLGDGRGNSGIGPDIIVAGYGDGNLKVFDIRSNQRSAVRNLSNGGNRSPRSGRKNSPPNRRRRNKLMEYAEHSSWIVDTFFTGFGGRYEVVSGCVGGDIKFWDLRMSSSLRTLDVQRSPMTALACHSTIPLLATGSHAQFIKILAFEGDTLQVIRYHEEIAGQRIGPVSCLSFHPHKPLLAAGATDEIVSLYTPN